MDMNRLKVAAVGLFLALGSMGACGSSGSPSGGTGGTSAGTGGTSAGTGGTTGGTGGSGGGSVIWTCSGSPCECHTHTSGTPSDTCTTKASCCMEYAVQGDAIDTCICNDFTGSSMTCAQHAAQVRGSVVTTCPPP